jgi:hypothetical protein
MKNFCMRIRKIDQYSPHPILGDLTYYPGVQDESALSVPSLSFTTIPDLVVGKLNTSPIQNEIHPGVHDDQ